jgi:GABA(A) receptor-associated protein
MYMFGDFMKDFKKTEFSDRKSESERVVQKYPDRCPVIVDRLDGAIAPTLKKNKYLVPRDLTIGQLVYLLKKYLKIKSGQAIFLFVKETLPASSSLIGDVFEKKKDIDGFLYVVYSMENAFG